MSSSSQPTRRDGALGVHSLNHFALAVPDLSRARDFYSAFGLDVREAGRFMTIHAGHAALPGAILMEASRKRLDHLSFGVFDGDLERFKQHALNHRVPLVAPPPHVDWEGLWVEDPDGLALELKVAPKTSPVTKSAAEFISSPGGEAGAPKRSRAPQVKPTRLAHCLVFTRNVNAAIAFYESILGLRLSDRSGDDIAFMHGIHGSDHHLIAFARSDAPGLHHCAWDVRSVNEVGMGAMQMAGRGYTQGWGVGRHVLGSNYFYYARDPYGSYCEYSCDMDYIPSECEWTAADHEAEDAFYVWGPNPPADWTKNHEAYDG